MYMQSDEVIPESYGLGLVDVEEHYFVTPSTIMYTRKVDGKLTHAQGAKARVRSIEMGYVEVTLPGKESVYMGGNVSWLEEGVH